MLKSLQWKIVLIYSLLLLFTLQLIGVYLVQDLERYYLGSYKENLENQAKLLSTFISPRPLEERSAEDIAYLIKEFRGLWDMDIMVLDSSARVVGSSGSQDIIGSRLIREEITGALSSDTSDAIRIDPSTRERRYYLAVPLLSRGSTVGLIYLNGSLKNVDRTLKQVKFTLITGSGIALAIGLCLGLILTRTITSPVLEVTHKARKMAQGDFSQRIEVDTADEIGQLGRSFNYLSSRLSHNLKEISAEKSKVEAIINYMNDGVVALDPWGTVIHINPAAQKIISAWPGNRLKLGDSGLQMLEHFAGSQVAGVPGDQLEPASFEVARECPPGVFQVQLAPFQQENGND
ncbi:MAG TPA: cell wall metabolism sensor histidine kinase WalK, partial [Firmicutes bacterium]|nr:cell wall metabolism sensor histidine kinase WalK [Bacillota bacterium]